MPVNILIAFNLLFITTSSLLSIFEGGSFHNELFFESHESKTATNGPVFNKIKYKEVEGKDYWYMDQSHFGTNPIKDKWDHIAIIVDRTKSPAQATYHQYKNGVEIPLTLNCFKCHSGGPRVIRPNKNSPHLKLTSLDKFKIEALNFRIKSYGEVLTPPNSWTNQQAFKKKLKVESCTQCHYQGGPRSELSYAQVGPILHLVENGEMPPWPYKLSKEDKNKIYEFAYGF
jgi:hypothetical protein